MSTSTAVEKQVVKRSLPNDLRLVILTGSPRSGTTWLGNILNSHPKVLYRHEPLFRVKTKASGLIVEDLKETGHLSDDQRQTLLAEWSESHHSCHRPPFFRKDFIRIPPAVVWSAWLAVRLTGRGNELFRRAFSPHLPRSCCVVFKQGDIPNQLQIIVQALTPSLVVIVRHPCAIVASRLQGQRLGVMKLDDREQWLSNHGHHLAPLGFDHTSVRTAADVEFLAIQWLVENLAYRRVMEAYPLNHLVVYEKLCRDPLATCTDLFEFLQLDLGSDTQRFIRTSTSTQFGWLRSALQSGNRYFSVYRNPMEASSAWKSALSARDIGRVLAIVRPHFADAWNEEWECGL